MIFDFSTDSQTVSKQSACCAESKSSCGVSHGRVEWRADQEGVFARVNRLRRQNLFACVLEIIILIPVDPSIDKARIGGCDDNGNRRDQRIEQSIKSNTIFVVGIHIDRVAHHRSRWQNKRAFLNLIIDCFGDIRRKTGLSCVRKIDHQRYIASAQCRRRSLVDNLERDRIP